MVMDVRFVHMSADDESEAAFQEALRKFISDLIGLFRRDLSRLKGLPHLIGNDVVLLCPAIQRMVLAFGKQKLAGYGLRIAFIRGYQLQLIGLIGIECVVCPIPQRLGQGFTFVQVHGDNACRCYVFYSFI